LHTGSAAANQLLAAEEPVGTWASVDLAAGGGKLASVARLLETILTVLND
jgi:hypothetical protein